MSEPCEQIDAIKEIQSQMVDGRLHFQKLDLTLQRIDKKMDKVVAQTTLTNGRVTKLELFRKACFWSLVSIVGFATAQKFGILQVLGSVLK